MHLSIRLTLFRLCASIGCAALLISPAEPLKASAASQPVRVMTLVMAAWEKEPGNWRGEAARWTSGGVLAERVTVPGLSHPVLCGESGQCASPSVPDRLSKAADKAAKRLRIPRSRLYTRAIETYLQEQGHSDVTVRLNAVYRKKSNRPDPALLQQGLETLRRAQWEE